MIAIKLPSGRTQFVPLQRYKRRDRLFLYYLGAIHLVAGYGLFKLIEAMYRWLGGASL